MIAPLAIASWWIAGTASIGWLTWRGMRAVTWADLLFDVTLGLFVGPAIWLVIAAVLVARADFWAKPIFGKRLS
jgi:hypothetical protein